MTVLTTLIQLHKTGENNRDKERNQFATKPRLEPKRRGKKLKKCHERTNRINNEVRENIHGGQGRQAMDNLTEGW